MNKAKSKKSTVKKKDNTIKYLITFIVLFSIVLIATVYSDIRSITQNVSETKEYNKLYEELLEEEASLNSEVIKLQDPEYVARYAREKFMYTKDGELILKIVDGKVLTTEDVVVEPANKEGEE
jgi:cell division protein DivIC